MKLAARCCSTIGCGGVATTGARCEVCRKVRQEAQDRRRGSSVERGYDAAHDRLRVLAFERDGWTCVDCGWTPEIVRQCEEAGVDAPPRDAVMAWLRDAYRRGGKHLHGDHIIPIEERPDLRLDLENYATRCNECHSAKTMRELRGLGDVGDAGRGNGDAARERGDGAVRVR